MRNNDGTHATREAAAWLHRAFHAAGGTPQPRIGIILGSGLSDLLADMVITLRCPYDAIPHFAPTTVAGHVGQFKLGQLYGQPIAVMCGRYHLYEGYAPHELALPVRTLHALGVTTLIVTNAAGGLNPAFKAGDLMLIRDHIGLPTLAGLNPLVGPNDDRLGPRFISMAEAYDADLRALARAGAARMGLALHEGVYIMVAGPTYETPAEMHALRVLGADAVGMSTVPEVIAARHLGMRVLGISCITNSATPEMDETVNHAAVLAGAQQTLPKLDRLLHEILHALAQPPGDAGPGPAPADSVSTPPTPEAVPDSADGRRGTFIIRTIKPPL
jgi:purine-nucleoside phosphorylase